ncbi:hypothetical protein ON021_34005, partial [Microcoleus sp. HI-ES]|nr:hypothetical protein [Microcoleus sp. HI-ES]
WWDSEGNWLLKGLAAYWRSIRIRFEAWWWLYFLRRGKEGDRCEGVAGDRIHLSEKNVTFLLSGCQKTSRCTRNLSQSTQTEM